MGKKIETRLTEDEIDELSALRDMNDTLGRKSFIMRHHWHASGYQKMVRAGLVEWSNPEPEGAFDAKRFAGTHITPKGREVLARLQASEAE